MKNSKSIFSILVISLAFSLIGCSNSESRGTRALFETRAEAEKAAKDFNCTGAHQMGSKWMPCKNHEVHGVGNKHEKYGGHHHHH